MSLIDISEYEWKGAEIQWVERNDYSISLRRMPLYKIPTVDAAPVVHGRWVERLYPGDEHVECSICKKQYYEDDLYIGGNDFPKYCPHCGAKMDGGDADGTDK